MAPRLVILMLIILGAGPVPAQPVLRWSPADTTIQAGQEVTLAIMLDDTLAVRTLEFIIGFDSDVVTTVAGEPGALFQGLNLFWGFEEVDPENPGQQHGYCVVLGASDWALGPGELFTWTVRGHQAGSADLATLNLHLLPPGGGEYETVDLPPTTVVVSGTSPVAPAPLPGSALSLFPNPFNPRVTVTFSGPVGLDARLEVFDLRGKRLGHLWQGNLGGTGSVTWEGQDAAGRPLPSGIYTFRLTGADGRQTTTRGTLLR